MAALVIPTVGNNRLRHETLQRFMLANDSTTGDRSSDLAPAL
jgi:hypothetical protein